MSDPRNRAALWLNDPSFVHGGDPVDELFSWMEKADKWDAFQESFKEHDCKYKSICQVSIELEESATRTWEKKEKLEAIAEIIKMPEVWNHQDPIKAIREILETSINNGGVRTQ